MPILNSLTTRRGKKPSRRKSGLDPRRLQFEGLEQKKLMAVDVSLAAGGMPDVGSGDCDAHVETTSCYAAEYNPAPSSPHEGNNVNDSLQSAPDACLVASGHAHGSGRMGGVSATPIHLPYPKAPTSEVSVSVVGTAGNVSATPIHITNPRTPVSTAPVSVAGLSGGVSATPIHLPNPQDPVSLTPFSVADTAGNVSATPIHLPNPRSPISTVPASVAGTPSHVSVTPITLPQPVTTEAQVVDQLFANVLRW